MALPIQANPEYDFWTDCVCMPGPKAGELVNAIRDHRKDRQVSYQTFARHADLAPLRASGHPAMYRISAPDNWAISFHRSRLPSGAPVYYFAWSGIEHFFVKEPVDVEAELAAMAPVANPTDKRLTWIAERYPAPVLYDTVVAFAAATARHALIDDIRYGRRGDSRGLTEPFSPSLVLKLATQPGQSTPYDRHLPWVATVLNREHKQAMKLNRRLAKAMANDPQGARRTRGQRLWREDVLEGLRDAKNVDEITAWLSSNDEVRKEYARRSTQEILAHDYHDYRRAAAKLEANLIAIVGWAEGEGIDLNTCKELEDVIEQAQTWAEEQAAKVDCDDIVSPTVYCWPDGWTVVELESTDELVCEGRILAHCVKDYSIDDLVLGGGDSRFFSLRAPTGKRMTTMMFDTTKRHVPGHALRGFANKTPDVPELARMYEFRMRYPDLAPVWVDRSSDAGPQVSRSSSWEGRYARGERAWSGADAGEEVLDLYDSTLYDAGDVSRALAWMVDQFSDSEYENAMEWMKSGDFAEQRKEQGLPPMTEQEMDTAALAESERQLAEQLDDFDPETLRHDYGYQIARRTFNGQDKLAGDLAWVHFLATGEELGGWDEGDEMADWMEQADTGGVAFFGTKTPRVGIVSETAAYRVVEFPFPAGSDYGVVMRRFMPPRGRPPEFAPHWAPERLHVQGSVNCPETVKRRLLA